MANREPETQKKEEAKIIEAQTLIFLGFSDTEIAELQLIENEDEKTAELERMLISKSFTEADYQKAQETIQKKNIKDQILSILVEKKGITLEEAIRIYGERISKKLNLEE